MGGVLALAVVLLLVVLAVVVANPGGEPSGAAATLAPTSEAGPPARTGALPAGISSLGGHGLIRHAQGGPAEREVLGADPGRGRTFSVDLGGSYRGRPESSCAYVRGTKVFPTTVSTNRYLQSSPEFRSQAAAAGRGPRLEHRYGYRLTFPYHGAGRYRFVYECTSDFGPGVDLFTDRRGDRPASTAAAVRGPLLPGGVLLIARGASRSDGQVRLGPIDVAGGSLVVHYERDGPDASRAVRPRSCLRRRGKVIASSIGPDRGSLLLTGRRGGRIPAARGTYELQFMCGRFGPALPISGSLFARFGG